jgi:hypothetical protein
MVLSKEVLFFRISHMEGPSKQRVTGKEQNTLASVCDAEVIFLVRSKYHNENTQGLFGSCKAAGVAINTENKSICSWLKIRLQDKIKVPNK